VEQHAPVDPVLQAKAEQKREHVQELLRTIERAVDNYSREDRMWLRSICDRSDICFRNLLRVLVEPKYKGFVRLNCATLRAVQLILRIAMQFIPALREDPSSGGQILQHMAGEELAKQVLHEVYRMSRGSDPNLACSALYLLGEFGPQALPPDDIPLLLKCFVDLPEEADYLVEIALRAHAWGGEHRRRLLAETIAHPGGQLLGEVLLQVVNRAEPRRHSRAVKILTGCLSLPNSEKFLYTNDARVLVEILLREMPNHASHEPSLVCHVDCFQALMRRIASARSHRFEESKQVLQDLLEDERVGTGTHGKISEVLSLLAARGGA